MGTAAGHTQTLSTGWRRRIAEAAVKTALESMLYSCCTGASDGVGGILLISVLIQIINIDEADILGQLPPQCSSRSGATCVAVAYQEGRHTGGGCLQAYNMLICGHAQAGDIAAATAVLESMVLKGLVPNRESYNTVISCLCRAGEAQQAQHVVSMAARRGIELDEWAWSAVVQVRRGATHPPGVRPS